ncbi:2,3-bisphosphoglycerate-independent phosphoglycerate mutase [Frankliniella fusca]|uniref:2,3-bisphosphoglycerate-independent phosphoglycerate mutase n=1 Tax=Frankliniella fusca TaxID=407009 RepID=A0AAE1HX50_9NEOP|nr:2,3-bisphosphoglycerate-independent phosphoglycerate mutase [Frankliniella fusca]
MRQRRKCYYRNCGHSETGNKKSGKNCSFYPLPKDYVLCSRWLIAGGVDKLTPKRVTAYNCFICSCHFPNGKSQGPVEWVEEEGCEDFIGPSGKGRRPSALVVYSPVKSLWRLRGKAARLSAKKHLKRIMDTGETEIYSDLGVGILPPSPSPQRSSCPSPLRPEMTASNTGGAVRNILEDMVDTEDRQSLDTFHETRVDFSDLSTILTCSDDNKRLASDENNNNMKEIFVTCSTPADVEVIRLAVKDSILKEVLWHKPLMHDFASNIISEETKPAKLNSRATGSNTLPRRMASFSNGSSPHVLEFCSVAVQCNRSFICYRKAKLLSENEFQFYTGISQSAFELLFEFLGGDEVCSKLKYSYSKNTPKRSISKGDLSPKDKLLMTLLRLRRGIPLCDLRILFNISEGYASKVVYTWVRFMSLQFKKLEENMFTSVEAQNGLRPKCLSDFQNLRVIIDSSEFRIQKPYNFQYQSNTFSDYKSGNTTKFLIGMSCFGGLSYISEAFEGIISDRQLLIKCGFLDKMQPHEAVMADTGFDAEDLFDERDLELLLIPAFLGNRQNFTARELILNRTIAVSRVHVETLIGKIKQFRLVRYIIPNTMLPIASDLVRVCAFLVNFRTPFIKDDDRNEDDED